MTKCTHVHPDVVIGLSYMPEWMIKQGGLEIIKHESINSSEAIWCPECKVLIAEWYRFGIDRLTETK